MVANALFEINCSYLGKRIQDVAEQLSQLCSRSVANKDCEFLKSSVSHLLVGTPREEYQSAQKHESIGTEFSRQPLHENNHCIRDDPRDRNVWDNNMRGASTNCFR